MDANPVSFRSDDSVSMDVESGSIAPINTLPEEVLQECIAYLATPHDIAACALATKKIYQLNSPRLKLLKFLHELDENNGYIGPETLKRCIGEIGEYPPLTDEILKELESPDPENEGKKKKETHILALIPERIGEQSLTLNSLNELVQKPKEGGDGFYRQIIEKKYGDNPHPKTSWVLMTKDVLNGSGGKSREEHLRMASEHGKDYRAPTLLETAFITTMLSVSKGIRFFNNRPYTYTCCQEEPLSEWKLVVGGLVLSDFSAIGYYEYFNVGVAAVRKF